MFDINMVLARAQEWGLRALTAILVYLVGWLLTRWLSALLIKWMRFRKIDEAIYGFVATVAKIALLVLLALACVRILGLGIAPFLTAIGAVGVAVSLAVKDSLSNLAGALFIMASKPFSRGDYVEIGANSGTVQDIGLLHVTLLTPDNKKVMIPNSAAANAVVVNYSSEPVRRADISVSVPYGADYGAAQEAALEAAKAHPDVLFDPAPSTRVTQVTDRALIFLCRAWVKTEKYWDTLFELNEQIRAALDGAGFGMPVSAVAFSKEKKPGKDQSPGE